MEIKVETAQEHYDAQNAQFVRHWAAVTKARAEELRAVGMHKAAEKLDAIAAVMTQ